jgi:hypothetical protein
MVISKLKKKSSNKSLETVTNVKYLETTVMNQYCIQNQLTADENDRRTVTMRNSICYLKVKFQSRMHWTHPVPRSAQRQAPPGSLKCGEFD